MHSVSIANRIRASFAAAVGMVLVIGFLSFYYLNQFTTELHQLFAKDLHLARIAEEIKTTVFDIHRFERAYLAEPESAERLDKVQKEALHLIDLVRQAGAAATKKENVRRFQEMLGRAEQYLQALQASRANGNTTSQHYGDMRQALLKIGALNRGALEDRYKELEIHRQDAERLASNAQRNMIIVMLLMLLSGLVLGFVAPNLVAAPFRRITRAIGEVSTGKLNVSIPAESDDELGTLAHRLNDMLTNMRSFDDMKIKRIAFEKRRLETLANMIDYGVIVLTCEGEIEFINTQLYLLLHLESEECVGRHVEKSPLPPPMKALLLECLENQEKFNNQELRISVKTGEGQTLPLPLLADLALVRRHDGTVANLIVTFEEAGAQACKVHLTRKIAGKETPSVTAAKG